MLIEPLLALLLLSVLIGLGVWLFRPDDGRWWRWQRAHQVTARVLQEDALKHLYHSQQHGRQLTLASLAGTLPIRLNEAAALLTRLEANHLIETAGGVIRLLPEGQAYALHVIRAHRLWERYLADETGFGAAEWHEQAERQEHHLTAAAADALSAQLNYPTHDPHGDPIPSPTGALQPEQGQPLTALPGGSRARIVHLEDEPRPVYAQLVAEGLYPGLELQMLQVTPQRVRFWANGDEHLLAPVIASNISVVPVTTTVREEVKASERLSTLKPGESGRVRGISWGCRRSDRRRLIDLGFLPGTEVTVALVSPAGEPRAYRVRDTLIALRREQADMIHVAPLEGNYT
ncbi:MAG: FeoA domain-containing protein [Chloroflexota bacterium]